MQTVIATKTFLDQAKRCGLSEEEIGAICNAVAGDPQGGDLIVGTGGAPKMRHAGRGRGKSGGYRTIHYWGGADVPIFLLSIYGKGTKDSLSDAEKRQLEKILSAMTQEYRQGVRRRLQLRTL